MSASLLPLVCEPDELAARLDHKDILVVDLSPKDDYAKAHIPGAHHVDYPEILAARPPVMGLLPEPAQLGQVLARIGWTPDKLVVACDHEGGGRAARLLWTLEVAGHEKISLLNGGMHAWIYDEKPLTTESPAAGTRTVEVSWTRPELVATREYILENLDNEDTQWLDARSAGEYAGSDVRASRGGHIPGAINLDWLDLMDRARQLRLKSDDDIRTMLAERGVKPQKDIATYCHTHHRSALNYLVLKKLGYTRVRGYPGSWSDWGNQPDTPIEQ